MICQSLTFSATVNPIVYQGAKPVFVDSDNETWNMDPEQLRIALEKYPGSKAVVVVHLYGLSANLDEIIKICKEYQVTLIEDAAESLGTTYKGQYTGTFGGIWYLFFLMEIKSLPHLVEEWLFQIILNELKRFDFGQHNPGTNTSLSKHNEIGYNYRMSNIVAGIGRGQLKVLSDRNQQETIYL